MRIRAVLLAPLAASALAAGAAAAEPGPGEAARSAVTAIGVAEREWRISIYRPRVRPGRVRFNVRNFGEDAHDLEVRGPGGSSLGRTPEIRAGRTATLTLRLRRPGRYRLLCAIDGHAELGMRAALRVVRRRGAR